MKIFDARAAAIEALAQGLIEPTEIWDAAVRYLSARGALKPSELLPSLPPTKVDELIARRADQPTRARSSACPWRMRRTSSTCRWCSGSM